MSYNLQMLREKFRQPVIRISFILAPYRSVKEKLKSRIFNTFNKKWKEYNSNLDINEKILEVTRKSDNNFIEVLIWEPKSTNFDCVVFFTNMSDGWNTLLENFSGVNNMDLISVEFSDNSIKYPIYSFRYIKGQSVRIIRSMKEIDKWEFYEKGNLLNFENKKNYEKRKIKERINNEIIIDYLKRNGINIEDEGFWQADKSVIFSTNLLE